MATSKSKSTGSTKVTFGKRKEGKHSKTRKPKQPRSKQYRGQGR